LRRTSAAGYSLLLAIVTVAIAEAALWALLVVFSYILRIGLTLDLGSASLGFQPNPPAGPIVQLFEPAAITSVLFCAGCGAIAGARAFRNWRPAP
jgi:hypothetical protein